MTAIRVLLSRVLGLFDRRHADSDLDEEIRAHLALLTAEHMRRGLSPDDARAAARRDFGAIEPMKEVYRDRRAFRWLTDAGQDLRFALRLLPRHPGFAAGVILTLALGIGMVTAVFTVFNAVVLRPLPLPEADRVVEISTTGRAIGPKFVFGPDFVEWRSETRTFDRMVAYGTGDQTLLAPRGPSRVRVADVTDDYWDLAGVRPAIGRVPRVGERNEVVVSHLAALQHFGSDTNIVGKAVVVDGTPMTVVGVLPAGFRFTLPAGDSYLGPRRAGDVDVYRPMILSASRTGFTALVSVVARLRPGMTIELGQAELSAMRARAARQPHAVQDSRVLTVRPIKDAVVGSARTSLVLMMLAVVCVLLIACANATNLLLARGSTRWREIAIRAAIGAGRGRVIRQLVSESLMLAGIAALVGVLVANAIVALIVSAFHQSAPRLAESSIDGHVVALVAAITVLTAVACSVIPAFTVKSHAPAAALNAQSAAASSSRAGVWTRNLLVAAECGLTLVLLAAGGLMVKSVVQMRQYPAGFEPGRVLTMNMQFSGAEYTDGKRQIALAQAVLDKLTRQPGVEVVSLSTHGNLLSAVLDVENRPLALPERGGMIAATNAPILITAASSQLQRVLGLHIVSGRWLTDAEDAVVVNEALVRREFPDDNPIGHRVRLSLNRGPWMTIVGVVSDLKYSKLDAAVDPELFFPYTKADTLFGFTTLVRTTVAPDALVPVMRRVVSDVDPTQAGEDVTTLEDALGESIAPRRLNLFLLATFATTSLILAIVGVFSVLSYVVAQRRHEIAVRLALGGSYRQVRQMIVRQGVRTIVPGILVGVVVAFGLRRMMASLLYGVAPTDLPTFSVVTALLTGAAMLACYMAARRVLSIDSLSALHHD